MSSPAETDLPAIRLYAYYTVWLSHLFAPANLDKNFAWSCPNLFKIVQTCPIFDNLRYLSEIFCRKTFIKPTQLKNKNGLFRHLHVSFSGKKKFEYLCKRGPSSTLVALEAQAVDWCWQEKGVRVNSSRLDFHYCTVAIQGNKLAKL